jgi:hypothetical protein
VSASKRTVLFLYNHDAAHQAAHVAGIMAELATREPTLDVVAATGTPEIERFTRGLIGEEAAQKVRWVDISLPPLAAAALALPNRIAPVVRLARLRRATELFATADLVISPERTCLSVRRALGDRAPRFVFVPHGAGDRSVTYHPELGQFDHFLLSGQKVIDEMVAHGIARPDQCSLIGYAKFDVVGQRPARRLFDNDRPTIVYNPHFDPKLSSWYRWGPTILEAIAAQPSRFNLVFAPHVMLFRKKLHISPEYRVARVRPDIPQVARDASNILIDTESPNLFDMTYTRAADIYLGDVSSQVYEFLRDPGACYFLDAGGQGPTAYQFWKNGHVLRDIDALMPLLDDWRAIASQHRQTQERLFAYTMNVDPKRTASERGAEAILDLLEING